MHTTLLVIPPKSAALVADFSLEQNCRQDELMRHVIEEQLRMKKGNMCHHVLAFGYQLVLCELGTNIFLGSIWYRLLFSKYHLRLCLHRSVEQVAIHYW